MVRRAKTPEQEEEKQRKIHAVLQGMREGKSAFKACQAAGVAQSTFGFWVDEDPQLAVEYARAREDLIERMAQEILELSDADVGMQPDGKKDWAAVQKHRLQVDSRKWLLSKLAPKRYGDKITHAGDEENPVKADISIRFVKAADA